MLKCHFEVVHSMCEDETYEHSQKTSNRLQQKHLFVHKTNTVSASSVISIHNYYQVTSADIFVFTSLLFSVIYISHYLIIYLFHLAIV